MFKFKKIRIKNKNAFLFLIYGWLCNILRFILLTFIFVFKIFKTTVCGLLNHLLRCHFYNVDELSNVENMIFLFKNCFQEHFYNILYQHFSK